MVSEILRTPFSRLFLIEDGAAPQNSPLYMGNARATTNSLSLGDLTPIRKASADQYGIFEVIDTIRGQADLPELTVEQRMEAGVVSRLLRLANKGCAVDVHVHFGACQNPSDFDGGWDIVRVLEDALPSTFDTTDLGAFDADADAAITETVPFAGQRLYDVKKLRASEQAGAALTDPVVDVVICDSQTCGACGRSSDGCQVVFALTGATSGSPGLPSELLYTEDGGATWQSTNITTLGVAEAANAMACVGTNLAVVSNASGSLHYAAIADILDGDETWSEVTSGFDGNGPPNAIGSVSQSLTFIAGDGGFVYRATDVTSAVSEVSDGSLTSENLTAIHVLDRNNALVAGENNALLVTSNGGDSWSLVTGPAMGVALTAVWMQSATQWLVGTAGGELYYTTNGGASWTEKGFPGSGAGAVRDLSFASKNVGYMAHDTATPRGRILRTINGGNSWFVLPEEAGFSIPANDRVSAIAACRDDVNVVFGGGIADDGTDGFLVKFA